MYIYIYIYIYIYCSCSMLKSRISEGWHSARYILLMRDSRIRASLNSHSRAHSISMKFVLQPLTIHVTNCDAKSRMMGNSAEKRKHGEMLPSTICAIICSPSNCGKTNVLISLLESPNVRFENVYVYSKSTAAAKVSISRKFIYVYRLLYVL